VRRAVEKNVLERFLDCGDPQRGFARIRCAGCGQDLLLAFSCKTRDFCPSCHHKRVLAWGHWVEASVLRPFFACHRSLLGELCRIISRSLTQAYRAASPRARPGFIPFFQTFGDLVNFNPHIHAVIADGVFEPSGHFVPLPPVPEALLAEQLRRAVLELFVRRRATPPRARRADARLALQRLTTSTTACASAQARPRAERASLATCFGRRSVWGR